MLIGKIVFSKATERILLGLILVFAAVVLVGVALKDELGEGRDYILGVQVAILATFQVELLFKLIAVGWVPPT